MASPTRRHRRGARDTVLDCLARLGLLPDLGYGRVRYRDEHGRRCLLLVYAAADGVVLVLPDNGIVALSRLEAGHFRGALKIASQLTDAQPGVRVAA